MGDSVVDSSRIRREIRKDDEGAGCSLPKQQKLTRKRSERLEKKNSSLVRTDKTSKRNNSNVSSSNDAQFSAAELNRLKKIDPDLCNFIMMKNAVDIIRTACLNSTNYKNLPILEYSESVLLQLCSMEKLDFASLTYKDAIEIAINGQWMPVIANPLREYINSKVTLRQILEKNHKIKLKLNMLSSEDQVFGIVPVHVHYSILVKYIPELDAKLAFNCRNLNKYKIINS